MIGETGGGFGFRGGSVCAAKCKEEIEKEIGEERQVSVCGAVFVGGGAHEADIDALKWRRGGGGGTQEREVFRRKISLICFKICYCNFDGNMFNQSRIKL